MRTILVFLASLLLLGCSQAPGGATRAAKRIVSLDYCADQYVLKFADRSDILALSSEARRPYSYLRAKARGVPQVRPRAADVLALQPDLVVRSYGGGPGAEAFFEQAGVAVIQIGYPQTIADVRQEVLRIGTALGKPAAARTVAAEMDQRLAALAADGEPTRAALYMTPGGVTAGEGTLVHQLFLAAGLANFQDRPGWNPIPVERLAYDSPDLVAPAGFEGSGGGLDRWSAARHPVAQAQLRDRQVVPLEGAWTSCGGWFLLDAIEALATGGNSPP